MFISKLLQAILKIPKGGDFPEARASTCLQRHSIVMEEGSQVQVGRPPYLPFTQETALIKVKAAQDLWNTRDPQLVKNGYTEDSIWRNRDKFLRGKGAIVEFLTDKWRVENGYRLRKELFVFTDNKIAIQFWYEYHDVHGQWYRAYGLEDRIFADNGLMKKRQMSGNDVKISQEERWFKDGVDVNSVEIEDKHW